MSNSYKPGIVASNRGGSSNRMFLDVLVRAGIIDGFSMEFVKVDLSEYFDNK